MFLLVLGGDFFHIRSRALVEYPGSAMRQMKYPKDLQGGSNGGRAPLVSLWVGDF